MLFAAPGARLRLAGLAAFVLGSLGLALDLAPSGNGVKLVGAVVLGLALAAAGAVALRRWPWLLAFATLACVPARIPVTIGSEEANLLLPLYLVVASLALALGWELVRGDERARELGPAALPLAALVAWTGLSLLWSDDVRQGEIFLLAFVLPFGVLAIGFARLPWRERALGWLYVALASTALAFAAIGVFQWATRDVFWNPKVEVGNAYAPFYRVNSVFWDPSIYGRYLVTAILATLVLVLLGLAGRRLAGAIVLVAATWVGLLFSFSQSSFAALVVGVLVGAAIVWRRRALLAFALVGIVLVVAGFSTAQVRHTLLQKSKASLNKATSGRAGLVSNGIRIAIDNPVAGVGVGSFKRAYAERTGLRGRDPQKAASHSTPVTVAAETGFPGLLLLLWFVGATLLAALRRTVSTPAGRASLAVGLTLGAIVVHSLFYNAFFEDPMTWALTGLVAVVAARRAEEA